MNQLLVGFFSNHFDFAEQNKITQHIYGEILHNSILFWYTLSSIYY
jgi:hypothetical protein